MYQLIHTPVGPTNRVARAANYSPRSAVQHFNGQRLIPNRALVVSEEDVLEHIEDLKERVAKGLVAVYTMSGERVDLDTMVAEPTPVTPPEPQFPSQLLVDEVSPQRSVPQTPDGTVPFDQVVRELGAEPSIPDGFQVPEEEVTKDHSIKRGGRKGR